MPLPRTDTIQIHDELIATVLNFSNGAAIERHFVTPFAGYIERLWLVASGVVGGSGVSVATRVDGTLRGTPIAIGAAQGSLVPTLQQFTTIDSPFQFGPGSVLSFDPTLAGTAGTAGVYLQALLRRT